MLTAHARDGLVVSVCTSALLGLGCGDDDDGARDGGAADSGSADAGSIDAGGGEGGVPGTIAIDGDYFRVISGPMSAVEGVRVCVREHMEVACAMTGADGTYHLAGVPVMTDIQLDFAKEGYIPALRSVHTGLRDMALFGFAFADNDYVQFFENVMGEPIDPAKGILTFEATGVEITAVGHADVEGVSATLSPMSGSGASYANGMYLPAPGLTETSRAGWGYFYNVDPGDYLVTFTHATRTCQPHPELAWAAPDGSGATTRVTVRAGYVVYTTAYCP